MSGEYYVRIRGRVHGPMNQGKLQSLVQKGQLSRVHEISSDGRSWQPAAKMTELFHPPAPATTANDLAAGFSPVGNPNTGGMVDLSKSPAAHDVWGNGAAASSRSESWYYAIGGAQQGPVSTAQLVELIRTNTVTTASMVWKNDMENWTEASNVPALIGHFESFARNPATPQAGDHSASSSPYTPSAADLDADAIATGRFEDVINFEMQKWNSSLLLAQLATILVGGLFTCSGMLYIVAFLFSVQFITIVIGLVNMVVGGMTLWIGVTLVGLRRKVGVAGTVRSGESIMLAIRAITPVWKLLAWAMIVTIILAILSVLAIAIVAFVALGTGDHR